MNQKTYCWKCSKLVSDIPIKIGFRAACPNCSSDLHVCVNCRYYAKGKPNDCLIPGTEPIRDREAANFCEDYKPLIPAAAPPSGGQARRILGEPEKKKDFKSLFKDDDQST